ncbi:CD209 antigen-like protein C [Megalobrama amblycephala]|uniref:CD209 antigen-like protein C n=1 Tax=Megalobrama amblycephala TaxID=75352 RepID=UPI0020143493|nr:CD209 antigen-like protein C [Megalobrama amblycephala]
MGIATENIYENYDVTSGKFEKETTDCNTMRIQSFELTGAEGVKIRSSRAAAVCLMLLCVLLLTAVIVLCVMFTGERQRLISKNDNLTDEKDQLIFMFTGERQQLISKNDNLTDEKDQLIFKNENLTRERDQLKQEKRDLQRSLGKMDGWTYYQSSLYFISSELKSWNESRRYCRDRGADLIIINNTTQQEFVNRIYGNTVIWIGLSKVDGRWKWVDGSALNSGFWAYAEPNGYIGQYCALSYSTRWYYALCDNAYRCICEKSILPNILP